MNTRFGFLFGFLFIITTSAVAQTTAFTYQGKLTDSGNLANASYDMQFKLFDAATNGTQIGSTLTFDGIGANPPAVTVTNGIFAVTLDFGTCTPSSPYFNGSNRFLEVAVKPHGSGSYTTLSPRQPITSTPYAMKTANLTFNAPYEGGLGTFTASNTFAGDGAGLNTTPNPNLPNILGKFNSFFGAGAGQANTTGFDNSFFGRDSGSNSIQGAGNTFIGHWAGINDVSGIENTFLGRAAGFLGSNTTGNSNTLLGALTKINPGVNYGTAIGYRAVVTQNNSIILGAINGVNLCDPVSNGCDTVNVGIGTITPSQRLHVVGNGLFTGNLTVTGALNATLPAGSANYIQNGINQQSSSNFNISGNGTAAGTLSGSIVNAATQYNIGGTRVLSMAGTNNIFAGAGAGASNTTGMFNAFFGNSAGLSNNTGSSNAFFGHNAGNSNTTGNYNSFFGTYAGGANTTGINNAFFGIDAGFSNIAGSNNSFFGNSAGEFTTNGSNSFFGSYAGLQNTTGFGNTFIGYLADFNVANPSGDNNTLLGANASINSGVNNGTAIGANAAVTLSNSLVLGNNANVGIGTTAPSSKLHVTGTGIIRARVDSDSNAGLALSLGNQPKWSVATVTSGQFQIFNDAVGSNALWIDNATNNVGIGNTAPADRLHVAGDIRLGTSGTNGCLKNNNGGTIIGTCSSDARFKRNITPFPNLLSRIVQLRPVYFYWRTEQYPDHHFGQMQETGLVAQEVEKVLPELVTEEEQGYKAVNYSKLPLLTLQAVKELKAENDTLKKENAAIKLQQQAQYSAQQTQIATQQVQLKKEAEQMQYQQREIEDLKRFVCLQRPIAEICKAIARTVPATKKSRFSKPKR